MRRTEDEAGEKVYKHTLLTLRFTPVPTREIYLGKDEGNPASQTQGKGAKQNVQDIAGQLQFWT